VRAILGTAFSPTPGGLPGNDDAGATAAWYVLAAVGLYPVAPGDLRYQLSSPLFDRITLRLDPPARKPVLFVIETHGNSEKALYIQSATLNGQPFARPWLTWEEIVSGGTLVLEMGETPSEWGVGL
jgi:putative alpha-1,2-mannosidase